MSLATAHRPARTLKPAASSLAHRLAGSARYRRALDRYARSLVAMKTNYSVEADNAHGDRLCEMGDLLDRLILAELDR